MAIVPSSAQSPFEALKRVDDDGHDYWSARDLCTALGYVDWRNFSDAVKRASVTCDNSGFDPDHHFVDRTEVMEGGRWGTQRVSDYRLTRYAAYLVAMNGDPSKPEIADAQTYFAVKTHEAEQAVEPVAAVAVMPNHAEALRGWADALERQQAAEAKVAELEPAAHSWEVLASSGVDFSVREAAYVLNRDPKIDTGQNKLFHQIRNVWRMVDSRDRPYSEHSHRVHLKPQTFTNRATGEETPAKPQVRVSAEGLKYMHRKLGGVVDVQRHIEAQRQLELT